MALFLHTIALPVLVTPVAPAGLQNAPAWTVFWAGFLVAGLVVGFFVAGRVVGLRVVGFGRGLAFLVVGFGVGLDDVATCVVELGVAVKAEAGTVVKVVAGVPFAGVVDLAGVTSWGAAASGFAGSPTIKPRMIVPPQHSRTLNAAPPAMSFHFFGRVVGCMVVGWFHCGGVLTEPLSLMEVAVDDRP